MASISLVGVDVSKSVSLVEESSLSSNSPPTFRANLPTLELANFCPTLVFKALVPAQLSPFFITPSAASVAISSVLSSPSSSNSPPTFRANLPTLELANFCPTLVFKALVPAQLSPFFITPSAVSSVAVSSVLSVSFSLPGLLSKPGIDLSPGLSPPLSLMTSRI